VASARSVTNNRGVQFSVGVVHVLLGVADIIPRRHLSQKGEERSSSTGPQKAFTRAIVAEAYLNQHS